MMQGFLTRQQAVGKPEAGEILAMAESLMADVAAHKEAGGGQLPLAIVEVRQECSAADWSVAGGTEMEAAAPTDEEDESE